MMARRRDDCRAAPNGPYRGAVTIAGEQVLEAVEAQPTLVSCR
jgi:hypothetical protein